MLMKMKETAGTLVRYVSLELWHLNADALMSLLDDLLCFDEIPVSAAYSQVVPGLQTVMHLRSHAE